MSRCKYKRRNLCVQCGENYDCTDCTEYEPVVKSSPTTHRSVRQQVYDKCQGHCGYCGCTLELKDMQIDHIVPLHRSNPGQRKYDKAKEVLDNYMPSCRSCNHYKHTMSIEEFRRELELVPDRMLRDSANFRQMVRYGQVQIEKQQPLVFYFERMKEDSKLKQE